MYLDVSGRDLSIGASFELIRGLVAKIWLILGHFGGAGAASGVLCCCLLLGHGEATETQQKPTPHSTKSYYGEPPFFTYYYLFLLFRFDHIFATVARIDLKVVPIDRSRRTTSKYIPNLIKLAR